MGGQLWESVAFHSGGICIGDNVDMNLFITHQVITDRDPPLLFADEPTSGLDSFMAESLVIAL